MAESNFRGPVTSMGSLEVDAATVGTLPIDGPGLFYQGLALPDVRSAPFAKDGFRPGQQAAVLMSGSAYAIDTVPQAAASNVLAASQAITAAVAPALATVGLSGVASAASIAVGVPIIPQGTTVATTAIIAIDFGFTTGTTVASSSAVTVIDNTLFKVGQWVVVGNVGNTAATRSLIAQVTAIATSNTTGINISPVAATGLSSVPIGGANLFGGDLLPPATQFGPAAASASAHSPYLQAGLARVANPRELSARSIQLSAGTTTATTALTVSGWDVWGAPMTEAITVPSGNRSATSFYGKKAFKYVGSIAVSTTAGGSIAVGLSDVFGFPFRSDEWEQIEASWLGVWGAVGTGWLGAVTTAATNTTGDARGTLQVSATGTGAAGQSSTATNGTSRLCVLQSFGVWNQIYATPLSLSPMYGTTQA